MNPWPRHRLGQEKVNPQRLSRPIPWLHGLGKCLSCFAQAASCGNWGDVSNCRVAFAHGVSVTDLPGLHGWHLTAQQPGDPGCVDVQTT